MTAEFIDLKTHLYRLPSHGLPYKQDDDVALINGDSLKIKPFVAGDQRGLGGNGEATQVYKNYLSKLIAEPALDKINLDKFLNTDLLALLFQIRILTYGEKDGSIYTRSFICTTCGAFNKDRDFNLFELDTRSPEDYIGINKETGEPECIWKFEGVEYTCLDGDCVGDTVQFHLPRIQDEEKVNEVIVRWQANNICQKEDEAVDKQFLTLVQLIDTYNGKALNQLELFKKLQRWHTWDYDGLIEAIADAETGIIPKLMGVCENRQCKSLSEVNVIITPEFFRPKRRKQKVDNRNPVSVGN